MSVFRSAVTYASIVFPLGQKDGAAVLVRLISRQVAMNTAKYMKKMKSVTKYHVSYKQCLFSSMQKTSKHSG